MNEMRKLMEAIDHLCEATDDAEVLKYFGGRYNSIKPGYKAFDTVDGEEREVSSISILDGEFGKEYHLSGPGPGGWRRLQSLDKIKIYKLERVL